MIRSFASLLMSVDEFLKAVGEIFDRHRRRHNDIDLVSVGKLVNIVDHPLEGIDVVVADAERGIDEKIRDIVVAGYETCEKTVELS